MKESFKKHYDPMFLLKATEFLNHFGRPIDYEQDDIEIAIAAWTAIPENYELFFEELYKKIDEKGDHSLKCALLPILERLSSEWSFVAQKRSMNETLSMKAKLVLCKSSIDKSPAELKREEGDDLFLEAGMDFIFGAIEVVEAFIAIEVFAPAALIPANNAYEHLSDSWDKINESAEAYREAERLEQEESSKKEDKL